jgi:predicted nucleic acid-binding protein
MTRSPAHEPLTPTPWKTSARWDLHRHAHEPLLDRIWELRRNVSAYDAVYLALAEVLDAILLTSDSRLARAPGAAKRELVTSR